MFCVLTMILRVPPCPAIMHQDVDLDRRSKTPITDDDMQDVAAALDFFVAKGVDSVSGTAPPALAETDQKSSRLLVLVRGVCGVGRGGCHRYLAALLPCYLATLLLCQLAILPSCHATLPFCYLASAILLPCHFATLPVLSCYLAILLSCAFHLLLLRTLVLVSLRTWVLVLSCQSPHPCMDRRASLPRRLCGMRAPF